ncbi:MAG: hypothetical protein LBK61_09050 [Spirochaetaceae bacterium]|jgi:hypothetical protein|nr:hypothetical protein [Spirochaetaceae bacterium]
MAKVGIKLADGKFHPILDEYGIAGKRLVLTTVCDGQSSAQIDFYRNTETVAEPMQYIGTLVVDRLPQKYAGEMSIDLRVRSTGDGRIFAEAFEVDGTGSTQKLEIDIAELSASEHDADDFDINDTQENDVGVTAKRRFNPIVPLIIVAVVLLVAATVFWFLSHGFSLPRNAYAEPQPREETVISPPPVLDDMANIPAVPPPAIPENNRYADHSPELGTVVPDTSRKALRTEFGN